MQFIFNATKFKIITQVQNEIYKFYFENTLEK